MISHERAALVDFIATGKPRDVGNYIARSRKFQEDLQGFFGPDLDMNALIDNLKSGKRDRVEGVRELLDEYFDQRSGKMAIHNMPMTVRRAATRAEAKENFELGLRRLGHGSVTMGLVDLTAAALSAFGLTKRERQLTMALFTSTAIAGMGGHAQAAISHDEVHSHANNFNNSAYSEASGAVEALISGGQIQMDSDYLLSPYLVQKMDNDPMAQQYVAWMFDAAEKNGINPVLFANQLFRESMHFKHSVIYGPDTSPAGAMGIGQFMESTGPEYGLDSPEDYYNPQKAIYAAARMMSDLTAEYDNDQILALAAYNGGRGAVDFAEEKLGSNVISGEQWVELMTQRNQVLGEEGRKGAWDVETLNYIADITGQNWDVDYRQWAVKLQGDNPIQYVQDTLSQSSALAAANALGFTPKG